MGSQLCCSPDRSDWPDSTDRAEGPVGIKRQKHSQRLRQVKSNHIYLCSTLYNTALKQIHRNKQENNCGNYAKYIIYETNSSCKVAVQKTTVS